ncbi:hypothetical protein DCAR_0311534 [Daucus carota subsp. sativus]|uniref:Uncharacterized protein n=1 Tax=Daucus carota subsp. sativus TaxID=79200 RepID=A0A166ALH7_DAUCS|nr:hypothetical protein DCAR_0311534 [Daucus carota subsp. sativus]
MNQNGKLIHGYGVMDNGIMDPKNVHKFYNDYHQYLASAGVDGVKVDVQSIWRVLALVYQVVLRSLSNTIRHLMLLAKNFSDNGCIDRMSQNTDSL